MTEGLDAYWVGYGCGWLSAVVSVAAGLWITRRDRSRR